MGILPYMGDKPEDSYSVRLQLAMKHANVDAPALAKHLRVVPQAIKKLIDGKSNAMTAANNSRAAKFLGVSADWLATGEGEMLGDVWPFVRITREQIAALDEVDRLLIEGQLIQAVANLPPHKRGEFPAGQVVTIPERRGKPSRRLTGGLALRRRASDKKAGNG